MAGDMFAADYLLPNKNDADSRGARNRAAKFCQNQLSKYGQVLYVMGNHEHYRGIFENTAGILRGFLAEHAPNTTLLDDEVIEIDGVRFLGTTLWASCGVPDPVKQWDIAGYMRDFRVIRTTASTGLDVRMDKGTRAFRPEDANAAHEKAKQFLADNVKSSLPTVLLMHHAPSYESAHGASYGEPNLDDAYCSNLVDFILAHDNIKRAIHGHTHHRENYRIGNALVVANPRGYFPRERISRSFDPSAYDFELDTLKEPNDHEHQSPRPAAPNVAAQRAAEPDGQSGQT